MDDILSQIIAYAPDRIDTETKARALVPGPRNMNQGGRIPFDNGGDAFKLKNELASSNLNRYLASITV